MSKATFVPAVTETRTIEVTPAKVVLEMTVDQASWLYGLLGHGQANGPLSPLYRVLNGLRIDDAIESRYASIDLGGDSMTFKYLR